MDFLYDWIKSIAIYMILISVVKNLLPKSHFEKYLRLFTGMLVVVLVARPFAQWFHLQETIDDLFSLDSYKQEMNQLQIDFGKLGEDYEQRILGSYERQVSEQISLLLKDEGVALKRVEFFVCMEEGSKEYGKLSRMEIYLEDASDKNIGNNRETETEEIEIKTPMVESSFAQGYQELERERLAEKICTYYQLERNQVEIYG